MLREAPICYAQIQQQLCELGRVLLERLRSDSTLVTHGTDVLEKKWDFARENDASLYVGMLAGGTQQTESCLDCRKRQGSLLCCQPPCLLWIHGTSYFRSTMDSSTAHMQVMPSTCDRCILLQTPFLHCLTAACTAWQDLCYTAIQLRFGMPT